MVCCVQGYLYSASNQRFSTILGEREREGERERDRKRERERRREREREREREGAGEGEGEGVRTRIGRGGKKGGRENLSRNSR